MTIAWFEGKIEIFRYNEISQIEKLHTKRGWEPFVKPPHFRFSPHQVTIAGTYQVKAGEHSPVLGSIEEYNIPAPLPDENAYEALARVYEPIIKARQKQLAKMRMAITKAKELGKLKREGRMYFED